ncbi:ABC-type transport auxiliary lipoprotein family protein [Ramlibacter tataouinensis]|uniref:ABC-type transport auxiliary lipoprotein component domain-containing protein n=1 Tax=Ramlibacter tataouinensis (strain ATCC BAA-407 / DSM 14655 / LMG 21543 / TTB310) TaxID=365046 RepID=F5Y4Q5_RAMTT|nr:ABC-type transport auxiliary lipoprotein family protein [Ramlibacter tataouinensis]AEG91373.1 Conserved hypothetical protein [Ramlibacter tataouinensis TTB310]
MKRALRQHAGGGRAWTRALPRWAAPGLLAALLAACGTFVDRPQRPTLYDFGPLALATAPAAGPAQPPLVLPEVEAGAALDGSAVLYRLGYADAHQLRPYAQSRWSAPPAQLIRQRLREHLGRQMVVLNLGEAALGRDGNARPRVLRLELEEFAQHFQSESASAGVLRLRATLSRNTPEGERLLAQRSFSVARPAPTPDAPGGVQALADAVDTLAGEIARWLGQVAPAAPAPAG